MLQHFLTRELSLQATEFRFSHEECCTNRGICLARTLLCNPRALAIAQTLQRHSVAGMGNFLLQCTSDVATTRNCFEHGRQLVIRNL
jgi:hypothetical protein